MVWDLGLDFWCGVMRLVLVARVAVDDTFEAGDVLVVVE